MVLKDDGVREIITGSFALSYFAKKAWVVIANNSNNSRRYIMKEYRKLIELIVTLAALFVASRMENPSVAAAFVGLAMLFLFWDPRPKN